MQVETSKTKIDKNINGTPKISVCVVTYNQEKYIRQCLQSIVDQVTSFPFEVVVGDDCSKDGTVEIVKEFLGKYPEIFRAIFREKNIGAALNVVDTYKQAKGEFIAHMDGDDFALPGKLQKQINALEQNPGCTLCTHDMICVDGDNNIISRYFKKHRNGVNNLSDLYRVLPFFAH